MTPWPTSTPTTSAAGPGGAQPPLLQVRALSPLVQPGAAAPVTVSYVEDALVQAVVHVPGRRPRSLAAMTDSHGDVTLVVPVPRHVPLHRGRAVASLVVRAASGAWHRLATRTMLVRPGMTWPIAGSYTPRTVLRVLITIPGVRPVRRLVLTDTHGHLWLAVTVPRNVTLQGGRALAHVTISALAAKRHARVTRLLIISDLVLRVVRRPIVDCLQPQTVHVAYHPNARLRLVLLFPNNHQRVLMLHTDRHGVVAVNLAVRYVKAPNPLHIAVEAIDTSVRPPRLERVTFAVALPAACRSAAGRSHSP